MIRDYGVTEKLTAMHHVPAGKGRIGLFLKLGPGGCSAAYLCIQV